MLTVTQEGAVALWRQVLGITPPIGTPYLHLYSSQHTVLHTDTEATFAAIEVAASGYAAVALIQPAVNWTLAPIGAGAQASYITVSWSLTSAATIWGYWLSTQDQSTSLWAELFQSAFVYGSAGGTFTLVLQPWLASWPDVSGIPCISP